MRETQIAQEPELPVPPAVAQAWVRRLRAAIPFESYVFGIFAALLALVTLHHEMWRDELQAWLIALNTHSIPQLVHALSYEGHPALWYLLLWIPSYFSPNPAGMQVINFVIALATAWVIVSAVRLPRAVRVLVLFSFFVFYQYGVIARSYELAVLLLLGAARCLVGERRRPWLAILLLALSMNTHVFAVPVAVVLAFWAFYLAKLRTWRDAGRMLLDREFLIAFVVLLLSGVVSLATVWPARDIGRLYSVRPTLAGNFLASLGIVWQMFIPHLPSPIQILLRGPLHSLIDKCVFSVLILSLAILSFRTAAARGFIFAATILETIFMALTVGKPSSYQFGLVFSAFIMGLLMDSYTSPGETGLRWMPRKLGLIVIYGLLSVQVLCAADLSALDWTRPYSCARETAVWLEKEHLDKNPLVLQPSGKTTAIIGYLERGSAYYPSCRCFSSYEPRNASRRENRMANAQDLKIARGNSPLPVILISNRKLTSAYCRNLGLAEIYETGKNALESDEIFYVYEQVYPPA